MGCEYASGDYNKITKVFDNQGVQPKLSSSFYIFFQFLRSSTTSVVQLLWKGERYPLVSQIWISSIICKEKKKNLSEFFRPYEEL